MRERRANFSRVMRLVHEVTMKQLSKLCKRNSSNKRTRNRQSLVFRLFTPRRPSMASHAARLSRIFTSSYASAINAHIVYPAESRVVKPNELASALFRPVNVSIYEPDRHPSYFAASLSYGIIQGMYRSCLLSLGC